MILCKSVVTVLSLSEGVGLVGLRDSPKRGLCALGVGDQLKPSPRRRRKR